jgi:hypothetical protein
MKAAERHNFTVVEDDIFCDLQAKTTPRLATLDQLNRVIYARSFSKTLSGSLRVGFVACAQNIANELADIKMLTSITTSQFTERLIDLMLVDGHYRKYLSRLRERLGEARLNVVRAFERMGLELFVEPADGMFVWARFPHVEDSLTLAEASQRDGIMLAPGTVFRPHLGRSPWVQRHRLRGDPRAALAAAAGGRQGGVTRRAETAHGCEASGGRGVVHMLMLASSSSSPRHRGRIERGVDGGDHRVIGGRASKMGGDRLQECKTREAA